MAYAWSQNTNRPKKQHASSTKIIQPGQYNKTLAKASKQKQKKPEAKAQHQSKGNCTQNTGSQKQGKTNSRSATELSQISQKQGKTHEAKNDGTCHHHPISIFYVYNIIPSHAISLRPQC
jgi:hypothetical protein